MGLNLEESMKILARNNLKGVGESETLKNIADSNGISPQQIYVLIRDAKKGVGVQASETKSEKSVPTGLGRKTLANAAQEYGFDLKAGLAKLARKNITATPHMTFKEVADKVGMAPIDVFEIMK
jgi:hypothetical protein